MGEGNLECPFVHRQQGVFLSVCVENMTMAGKKHNLEPMWKRFMKHVDLRGFLTKCNVDCVAARAEVRRSLSRCWGDPQPFDVTPLIIALNRFMSGGRVW